MNSEITLHYMHWLRQTFLLSVWSIVHFWDFSNVSLKLLFNRMHIYSSCICLIFPCCFLDSNACSQVCTQIACLGRCKITPVEFFPTALCLSNASSNHLSERISIHTDCTSVTTVYNVHCTALCFSKCFLKLSTKKMHYHTYCIF